ncbi:hypothetical protein RirG_089700 [Rhizophagus irregularis DAOM 197198w]|uniref:Mediator of RNA polymerase II transcription subunit 11 n=1 Tax=Rhizophagus irregularis (strain DAOM 197198w) TaxID=1432141 RepID=A0A015JSD7_RHIIW|nr:hypothetical protein RirG_089700 [Rhizophagus irregularis DAOM 197198w]
MNQNENTRNVGHLSAERIRNLEVIEKMIVELMDTAAEAIMGLALDGHISNNDEETSKTELTVKKRSPEEQIEIFQNLTKKFNDLIDVEYTSWITSSISPNAKYGNNIGRYSNQDSYLW